VYFVLALQLVLCCEPSMSINEELLLLLLYITFIVIIEVVVVVVGRDSSVGIAICFGLDGPGIESRCG